MGVSVSFFFITKTNTSFFCRSCRLRSIVIFVHLGLCWPFLWSFREGQINLYLFFLPFSLCFRIYKLFASMGIFRTLREMFKIDAADYMLTICGNDALRELSSPGKSGSIFFLSHDDRFLIKTLRKQELKVCI